MGNGNSTAEFAHTQLIAAHDSFVARNDQEEFGLDSKTLAPIWHAPAPNYLASVDEYVLETPSLSQAPKLRLRRASDEKGAWVWVHGDVA